MKYIKAIGVELEGGWNSDYHQERGYHEDGSVEIDSMDDSDREQDCQHECDEDCEEHDCRHVHVDSTCGVDREDCPHECDGDCYRNNCRHECDDDCYTGGSTVGEMVTPDGGLSLHDVQAFMDKWWPDAYNSSCGMHVHLSFVDNLTYSRLMTIRFYNYFIRKMTEFGKSRNIGEDSEFWSRLKGGNEYCYANTRHGEYREKGKRCFRMLSKFQLNDGAHRSRYAHLNFCYSKHGTMEIRLLPMLESCELAKDAVRYMVRIIEGWLSKKSRERLFTETLVVGEVKEETEVEECALS